MSSLAFVGRIHRWISRKRCHQWSGKCFQLMTSSWPETSCIGIGKLRIIAFITRLTQNDIIRSLFKDFINLPKCATRHDIKSIPYWYQNNKDTVNRFQTSNSVPDFRKKILTENNCWFTAQCENCMSIRGQSNIKMRSCRNRNSCNKDGTVSWSSHLYNGNHYSWTYGLSIETGPRWLSLGLI